jgi:hypothetical protein
LDNTLEVCEKFAEEPMSVAIHPSGFHLAIGFTDRLRFCNIFGTTIKSFKEIPIKGSREV